MISFEAIVKYAQDIKLEMLQQYTFFSSRIQILNNLLEILILMYLRS